LLRKLVIREQVWPTKGSFTISRGSRTEVRTVIVEVFDGDTKGHAECVPYARYDETVASVIAQLNAIRPQIEAGADQQGLLSCLPGGAARNGIDSALWDLQAKLEGCSAADLLSLPCPPSVITAYTLSLDTPENMARKAKAEAARPLLKIKVGTNDDVARVAAVRRSAPDADLIVDANEGWTDKNVAANLRAMADLGVAMVEQPVPAGADNVLGDIAHAVPICADEACHTSEGLQALVGKYDMINIKIDKTGGLTGAKDLLAKAKALELEIMVGCMLGSSLAMAPAYMLAGSAKFVDLDGPLLLAADFEPGIRYQGSVMYRPASRLWG